MNQPMKMIVLVLVSLACALLHPAAEAKSKKDKQPRPEELEAALEQLECSGIKPRVAIYGFFTTGRMVFKDYSVGDALAAQLATTLAKTDCFIVLDRTGMSELLREQELGLAGMINSDTAPAAGGLLGAEVIIKGTITEFDPNSRGGGMTVGVNLPNSPLGVRLGRKGSEAHVGLDVSVIDTATGQIKFSHRVTANSKMGGWTMGLDVEDASVAGSTFAKSPLGIASRNALGQAVLLIADDLKRSVQRRFQIASSDAGEVYLNANRASGIKEGDLYKVSTVVRVVVDPATGLLLDSIERQVGEVRITEVTDRYAKAELVNGTRIKRGDFVHL